MVVRIWTSVCQRSTLKLFQWMQGIRSKKVDWCYQQLTRSRENCEGTVALYSHLFKLVQ